MPNETSFHVCEPESKCESCQNLYANLIKYYNNEEYDEELFASKDEVDDMVVVKISGFDVFVPMPKLMVPFYLAMKDLPESCSEYEDIQEKYFRLFTPKSVEMCVQWDPCYCKYKIVDLTIPESATVSEPCDPMSATTILRHMKIQREIFESINKTEFPGSCSCDIFIGHTRQKMFIRDIFSGHSQKDIIIAQYYPKVLKFVCS